MRGIDFYNQQGAAKLAWCRCQGQCLGDIVTLVCALLDGPLWNGLATMSAGHRTRWSLGGDGRKLWGSNLHPCGQHGLSHLNTLQSSPSLQVTGLCPSKSVPTFQTYRHRQGDNYSLLKASMLGDNLWSSSKELRQQSHLLSTFSSLWKCSL